MRHSYDRAALQAAPAPEKRQLRGFKPLAHRTIALAFLAVIALTLTGVLEYVAHVLPQVSFDPAAQASNTAALNRRGHRDRATKNGTETGRRKKHGANVLPTSTSTSSVSVSIPVQAGTAQSAYNNGGGTTVTTSTASVSTTSEPQSATVVSVTTSTQPTSLSTTSTRKGKTRIGIHDSTSTATSPLSATSAAASASASSSAYPALNSSQGVLLQSETPLTLTNIPGNYFLGVYLPVLIAILFRLLIGYVYRCTQLLSPFFELSRSDGVAFKDFFWSDHLGGESFLAPVHALRSRNWPLFVTATTYSTAQLLMPFAAELTSIQYGNYNFELSEGSGYVRGRSIWINPVIVHILEALLVLIFFQLVIVWALLRINKSGVSRSPASIATIASLMGHPDTARDFAQIDQYADKKTTTTLLGERRYRLGSYVASEGSVFYGIIPFSPDSEDGLGNRVRVHSASAPLYPQDRHKPYSASKASIFILLLTTATAITLIGVIAAYAINTAATPFEQFMDSQSFGPRFLLTTLGLIVKSPLLALCARAIAAVPFHRLATRPRHAELDLLDPVPVTPLGSIWYAIHRQQWFAASTALAAGVLIEILLVLLPGVPFQASEYYSAALASWYGSIVCLGFILLVAIAGWLRLLAQSRADNRWPKTPTTLGAIALYVAGTSVAADCAAMGAGGTAPGARYEFGRREGRWVVEYADDVRTGFYAPKESYRGTPASEEHVVGEGGREVMESAASAEAVSTEETAYDAGEWREQGRYQDHHAPRYWMHAR